MSDDIRVSMLNFFCINYFILIRGQSTQLSPLLQVTTSSDELDIEVIDDDFYGSFICACMCVLLYYLLAHLFFSHVVMVFSVA